MGVDIGGTKTFVAALDDAGVITEKVRFPTPRAYAEFVSKLKETAAALQTKNFRAGCAAVPGSIDRQRGIARRLGNLPWRDVPLQEDAEHIFACPILLEHDAALGGLSEAMLLPKDTKVLYITISTGIGTGFIDHQHIIPDLADSEGGQMLLEYHGKPTKWEDFASGRAIAARFGKQAVD
ncbi:MAG TPA: ROK family protein, partial [Chroococcales cyanobacterium]